MDGAVLFSLFGIAGLLFVIYRVFAGAEERSVRTRNAETKRLEIIEAYKRRLDEELSPYLHDPKTLKAQKAVLLKDFSIECSRNVFFGPDQVREVIAELAGHEVRA